MFEELWTPITESFKTTKLDKKNLTLRRSFFPLTRSLLGMTGEDVAQRRLLL